MSWVHGKAVVNGQVRFLSASAMTLADPTEDGCLRKWWWQYPGGHKPPSSKKQERGVEGHAQLESYLLTGTKNLGKMAMSGLHFVPDPGPDLDIERDLLLRPGDPGPITAENSQSYLNAAPLRAFGIPVTGKTDCGHSRGYNKGTEDFADQVDPPGTREVLDWKFVTDDRYLKTPAELRQTIQMVGYGKWVLEVYPQTTHVRLSHGYFLERGRSRKVTTLVGPEEINRAWEHADGVARSIAQAAREKVQDGVDYNLSSCSKYGGCAHASYCKAYKDNAISALVGATAADHLLPRPSPPPHSPLPKGPILVSSLLKVVQKKKDEAAKTSLLDPAKVAAERAKLEFEERVAAAKHAIPAGFEAACERVRGFQRGFPHLTGAAAVAFGAMGGQLMDPQAANVPGLGEIEYIEFDDPATMQELADQLAEDGVKASPLPPDAPASDPALASETGTSEIAEIAEASEKKAGKKRAKKSEPVPATGSEPAPATGSGEAIYLFIDCRPSCQHEDLHAWVQELCQRLANEFDAIDVRCPPGDSAIAFGKWQGALAAMVRSEKHAPLAGGCWYLDTRGSSVGEVVADALKARVEASGGFWARAAR